MKVLKAIIFAIIGIEEARSRLGTSSQKSNSRFWKVPKHGFGDRFNAGLILTSMSILHLVPMSPDVNAVSMSAKGLAPNSFVKPFPDNVGRVQSLLLCNPVV
jgi:hypothetical protein